MAPFVPSVLTKPPLPKASVHHPPPHCIPPISAGQREAPEGAELSDSLSSARQAPKPKSSDGDLKSAKIQTEDLCSFARSAC